MSSGDYYVGHPTMYTAPAPETKQAPQVVAAAGGGGEQIPAVSTQTPGATHNCNYFVGHPVSPEKTLQPAPSPPPPPAHKKRSGFLAICFPCIGGSRVAEQ